MLNSIDAHDLLWMVDPVKNTPVTDTQFAQAGEVIRHADQPAMNHHHSVFRQPDDFTLDCRAEENLAEKFAYICQNPVRAGLTLSDDDWPYIFIPDRQFPR
jgi:hypothetical protein